MAQQLLHVLRLRGFQFEAQVRRFRVGAAYLELFDFKTTVAFDHGVENLFHHVGIDQVARGLDDFLLHRVSSRIAWGCIVPHLFEYPFRAATMKEWYSKRTEYR